MKDPTSARPEKWAPRLRRNRVVRWLREPQRLLRIEISLLLSLAYVGLLLFFTGGRLLWGSDFAGVYSWQDSVENPYLQTFLYAVAIVLAGGNVYAGFYLGLFGMTFFTAYTCQLFTWELVRFSFSPRETLVAQGLAAGLYLVGPSAFINPPSDLFTNVYITAPGIFLFLYGLVRLLRAIDGGTRLSWWDAGVLGVGFSLSASRPFPNDVRMAVVELFAGVVAVVALLLLRKSWPTVRRAGSALARTAMVGVPVALVVLGYHLYVIWMLLHAHVNAIATITGPVSNPHFQQGTFNDWPIAIRLLSRWAITSTSTPYRAYFLSNPYGLVSTYVWAALALVVTPALSMVVRLRARLWMVALSTALFVGVVWITYLHFPFGPINAAVASLLPSGRHFLPTDFLNQWVLPHLYAVLVAVGVVLIYRSLAPPEPKSEPERSTGPPQSIPEPNPGVHRGESRVVTRRTGGRTFRRWGRVAVSVVLVGVLLLAAEPLFTGEAESLYFNTSQHGFIIPQDYFTVKNLLLSSGKGAVLLPSLNLFLMTTWGYEGAENFYSSFFYPATLVTPFYVGNYQGYAEEFPSAVAKYHNLTQPIAPGPPTTPLFTNLPLNLTPERTRGTFYQIDPATPLNVSGDQWLSLQMNVSNPTELSTLISLGAVWIEIHSKGTVKYGNLAWYILGQGSNSIVNLSASGTLRVDLMLKNPSVVGRNVLPVNLSAINRIWIWIRPSTINYTGTLCCAQASGIKDSVASAAWLQLMAQSGFDYLVIDRDLVTVNGQVGATQSYAYVNTALSTLTSEGHLTPTYLGHDLQMYRLHF